MPSPVDAGHNLHSLYMRGFPLGVECRGCGHRSLALRAHVETSKGNMTTLRSLPLVCSSCRSREWNGWLFTSQVEADGFLEAGAGGPAF